VTCARSFLIMVVTRCPSGSSLASHHTFLQHSTNSSTLTTNSVYNSQKSGGEGHRHTSRRPCTLNMPLFTPAVSG